MGFPWDLPVMGCSRYLSIDPSSLTYAVDTFES